MHQQQNIQNLPAVGQHSYNERYDDIFFWKPHSRTADEYEM